jgi:hypothetical protein
MDEDQVQRPESLLPYDLWTEEALRHVVAQAVRHVVDHGLPGDHHFYLTFRTDHPRVVMPPRLRTQYPQEMTIVLQHQFWDLRFDEETGMISVTLSFGGVPANLVIPLSAMTAFADPQVGYGLRFTAGAKPERAVLPAPVEAPEAEAPAEPGAETPQVVSLDAFRRRTQPKD